MSFRKNKFNVAPKEKRTFQGIVFDSLGEMERYLFLVDMKRSGHIQGEIQRQVPYRLVVNNILVCKYVADFVYTVRGVEIVEDFKGFMTPTAALKNKLFAALFDRNITIIKKPKDTSLFL